IENDENAKYYNQDDELDDQLTQTSDGNTSTNSYKNTGKLSPLWQHFSFDSNHPDIFIYDKCSQKFLSKSGNSSLERHLSSQYNIIISKIKCYQTKLPFVHNNS
ncbi:4892_t:CDS:1, partial [Racocetra persica]